MAELRVEPVMGTTVRVEVRDARVAPGLVDEAIAWLRWVDARLSTYRPDSEISRVNRGELALRRAHPLLREVLAGCAALTARTGGRFDAGDGPYDPSGYVKGWAVDRAVALLAEGGARELCVSAGGDLRVRGGCWRVGVQHPWRHDRVAAVLELSDGAVATSGAYERGPHVVDPRSGLAASGAASVTVVGPDLGSCDAYATAAFAMGAEGPAWTATLRDHGAMTILPGGRVLSTEAFLRHRVR